MGEDDLITYDQAIQLLASKWWTTVKPRVAFEFQATVRRLCMPAGEYHRCAEVALGRVVFAHELVQPDPDALLRELHGEAPPPTFRQILDLLPRGTGPWWND